MIRQHLIECAHLKDPKDPLCTVAGLASNLLSQKKEQPYLGLGLRLQGDEQEGAGLGRNSGAAVRMTKGSLSHLLN